MFLTALFDGGKSWVARINITYTVLTAGSILGLAMFPFLVRHPELGVWALPALWLSYTLTMFRGAPGVLARSMLGRVLKSIAFGTLTIVLVTISGIVTSTLSSGYAAASHRITEPTVEETTDTPETVTGAILPHTMRSDRVRT